MIVTITLTTAGSDTGPFDLYSDLDGYTSPFQTGVARTVLVAGLTTGTVPDGTTEILVQSTGTCERDLYLIVEGAPTTTTTSTTTSTTSTTTTIAPSEYILAQIANYADASSGCSLGTILRIFLDSADYALFVANFYSFGGIGGGGPNTCTAIARNSIGAVITGYLFDSDNVCWKLTGGNFTYNSQQC
jgi:hypothetical protein